MSMTENDERDPFAEGVAAARARRMRSVVIALALVAFVLIVFVVTMLKLTANAAHVVPQT
jgi:hypothetical protein